MSHTFECYINDAEEQKMNEFITKRRNEVAEQQLKDNDTPFVKPGEPYGGAIGGTVTLSFTPTSIGTVIKVTCWGETLDITDYGSW